MKTGHNDLFRFVSVRGPEPVYTVDPTKDLDHVEAVGRLATIDVNVAAIDPEIPGLLDSITVWDAQNLSGSTLDKVRAALDGATVTRVGELHGIQVQLSESTSVTVGELAVMPRHVGRDRVTTRSEVVDG
jgi:hypothetical protein